LDYFDKHNLDRHDVCRKIGRLYSEMIFVKGYIHCDPHPGNVLVRRDPRSGKVKIVLLDHGLYQSLTDEFRIDYSNFWLALLKPDKDEIHRICMKMGIGEFYGLFSCIVTARSWQSVTQGIRNVSVSQSEQQEIKEYASSLITQISQVLDRMPREMLLILKTNDLLRSIEHRLGTQFRLDSFTEMTRCCTRAVYEDAVAHTKSYRKVFSLYFAMYTMLAKIYIYECFLIISDWFSILRPLRN
jgi:aarF domain-containing kinase